MGFALSCGRLNSRMLLEEEKLLRPHGEVRRDRGWAYYVLNERMGRDGLAVSTPTTAI